MGHYPCILLIMILNSEKDPPLNNDEQGDSHPHFESEQEVIEKYKFIPFGATISVPISMIEPSQEHDGRVNESPKPVPVFMTTSKKEATKGKIVLRLIEGNHRYFGLLEKGAQHIVVEKKRNPEY
jgi:hypothetical protein